MYGQKQVNQLDEIINGIIVREDTSWTKYKVQSLNEEDKSIVADNIVTKLFNDIKSKSMDVDFSIVDDSKGNILKLKNYKALANSLKYLDKIAVDNKEIKELSDELNATHDILVKYSKEFELGFKLNKALIRYLYNSVTIGLIQATTFTISESVEFVKDNINLYKPEVKSSKHLKKNNHINALKVFNSMERNKQLPKYFKDVQSQVLQEDVASEVIKTVISGSKAFVASTFKRYAVQATIVTIALSLTLTRSLIFTYYNSRVRLSQYFKYLEGFVEMNAVTLDPSAKDVKEKQLKIAERLGKLSDIISVDQNVSNDRASSQIDQSNKIIAISADEYDDVDYGLDLY